MRIDWVTHAVLGLGVLLFALPVWLVLAGSTQSAAAISRGGLSLVPDLGGLGVYVEVLRDGGPGSTPVWRMLLVSFAMATCIAVGKIVISVLSAYAIAFFRWPGRGLAFAVIFLTLMLPVEVRIIPTYSVMAGLGLINTFTGLTLPLIASATATLLFRQVFLAVPDEQFDELQAVRQEVLLVQGGRDRLAPPGDTAWDAVLLVRYPSRRAFSAMVADPEYQQITHLRTEALDAAVLQATVTRG